MFLKLSDIDTVKEQFAADVFIESRWREKSLDHGKVEFYQTALTLEFRMGGGGGGFIIVITGVMKCHWKQSPFI